MERRQFSKTTIAAVDQSKILGIRAGVDDHRFIGIWAVVVNGRVFVRSWNDKPRGWHRAFLDEPRGTMQVGDREIPIRVRTPRGERLLKAIDAAYGEKYNTPGSRKWVRGFARGRRRLTTTELVPR
jgi:hypothetical protein